MSTKSSRKSAQVVKKAKSQNPNAKLRQKPKYKSFRMHKLVKHHEKPLMSSWQMMKKTLRLMSKNKLNLLLFSVVYGVLFLLFVRGIFNPINIDDIRLEIESSLGEGESNSLNTNRLVFGQLVGTLTSGLSGEQGVYQIMLLVISSLALIWLYRQQQAGNKVNIKQAFYRGMYPLIPFTLLIYLVIIQLLPAIVGNFLYSTVISGGIAVGGVERFIWLLFYMSTLLLSFYLISSTIIALMVVTLPEMTPMIALKKAKELTTFRRFSIFRKIIMLCVFIALAFVAFVIPALFINAMLAQIVFLAMSIIVLPFAIGFMFVLYRELL